MTQIPAVRIALVVLGFILMALTPVVGPLPGPGGIIVFAAGLSFLGLGVEPGTADWGRMLSENRNLIASNPPGILLPAGMIILTAISMNLIGDWLFERFTR